MALLSGGFSGSKVVSTNKTAEPLRTYGTSRRRSRGTERNLGQGSYEGPAVRGAGSSVRRGDATGGPM